MDKKLKELLDNIGLARAKMYMNETESDEYAAGYIRAMAEVSTAIRRLDRQETDDVLEDAKFIIGSVNWGVVVNYDLETHQLHLDLPMKDAEPKKNVKQFDCIDDCLRWLSASGYSWPGVIHVPLPPSKDKPPVEDPNKGVPFWAKARLDMNPGVAFDKSRKFLTRLVFHGKHCPPTRMYELQTYSYLDLKWYSSHISRTQAEMESWASQNEYPIAKTPVDCAEIEE